MRFAHISDLHVCSGPAAGATAREDIIATVEALAGDLARIAGCLDFIVLSGDMTDDARPESFRKLEELFAPLALPIFTVPGNHDGPAAYFRKVASGRLAEGDLTGRVVDLGAVRLLGLDTCVENEATGALSAQALDLVARELDSNDLSQLIIVMHHPPFAPGLRQFDEIVRLEGAAELARLVAGAARAPIVLSGHVHRAYQARWNGANCFVAGSAVLPFTAEHPYGDGPIRPSAEQRCYFVHAIDADGMHVVTPQPVRSVASAREPTRADPDGV
ncbi:MAG: metallophosphoesterase family protein [Chromatiales bacterium]|nr:metallophosphoesterase family protein [Chromatiales bacterium]